MTARWVFERASNAFAHCGISSVEKELNLLFSPLFLLEGVSSRARRKKIARARALATRTNRATPARTSLADFSRARASFFASARYSHASSSSSPLCARDYTSLERRTLGEEPAKRESCASSRKNPKNVRRVERTFLSSSFDQSSKLVSRAFLQNGLAREFSVPSENETSRKHSYYDARVVSLPPTKFVQMLVFLFLCSRWWFFSPKGSFCAVFLKASTHASQANEENLPFFVCFCRRPPQRGDSRFFYFFLWKLIP